MRIIQPAEITGAVSKAVISANHYLPYDIVKAAKTSASNEKNKKAKNFLYKLTENYKTSKKEIFPLCQDTGIAVIFLKIGSETKVEGDIYKAINKGVEKGYTEGYLRKSVADPFTRENTGTNTPCIIHTEIIKGSRIKMDIMTKGAGAENKSAVKMLMPSDGEEGIIDFVLETVKKAGASACPPFIVGVGVGGNLETAPLLAKKSLLREISSASPVPAARKLEKKLLELINKTGIGPMGLGGDTTAFAVFVESLPCHIASLPVAVNIQCHSSRHKSITI